MLTLTLLRHAKSSWDDDKLSDFDRPLSPRGERTARLIGSYMRVHGIEPELVLCSTARRTVETLGLVRAELASAPKLLQEDGLYLASAARLLARIREVAKGTRNVMIVGHNPGLHALALDLVAAGRREDIAELARKLPTGGLVVIGFTEKSWKDVQAARGGLRLFVKPSRLA